MKFLSLVAAFAVVACASVASASVQFELNKEFNNFSGAPSPLYKPQGPTPWLTIRIYDSQDDDGPGAPPGLSFYNLQSNEALIVMDANLIGTENISEVGLNYDGASNINISYLGGGVSTPVNIGGMLNPGFRDIDNSVGYELFFDFGVDFTGNDFVVFKVTGTGTLDDQDFVENILNDDAYDSNEYGAAAEVQGIPTVTGSSSGSPAYITNDSDPGFATGDVPIVPEPASLAIWGLGSLFGAVAVYRRKRRAS